MTMTAMQESLEELAGQAYHDVAITAVIRPAAVLPESAAREVLLALAERDASCGGTWTSTPTLWQRYDLQSGLVGDASLLGSLQVVYGSPRRHAITIYRATITVHGAAAGWTVEGLCDEALGFAGLSLASCPRAELTPPPKPFRGPLA